MRKAKSIKAFFGMLFILVMFLSFAGCGESDAEATRPEGARYFRASEHMWEAGLSTIAIADQYLDGDIMASDAAQRIEAIQENMSAAESNETSDALQRHANEMLRINISAIETGLLIEALAGLTGEPIDNESILRERNNLATGLGMDER